jgi:spermidine/putrescine transport system permease protein
MIMTAKRSRRLTTAVLLVPALGLLLVAMVVPVVDLIIQSFQPSLGTSGGLTLSNYSQVLSSSLYEPLILKTFWTALAATVITIVLALPAAWAMTRIGARARQLVICLLAIPYLTSFLLLIYSMLVLLAAHGPLMDLLNRLHLVSSSSSILYTPWATLVMLVYESLPIAILVLFPVFERIDTSLLLAARGLGATTSRVLIRVILPLSQIGMVAAAALVFIPLMGVFAESEILGGPNGYLFGNGINDEVQTAFNTQLGAAMSIVLIVYVLVFLVLIAGAFFLWRHLVSDRLPREVRRASSGALPDGSMIGAGAR